MAHPTHQGHLVLLHERLRCKCWVMVVALLHWHHLVLWSRAVELQEDGAWVEHHAWHVHGHMASKERAARLHERHAKGLLLLQRHAPRLLWWRPVLGHHGPRLGKVVLAPESVVLFHDHISRCLQTGRRNKQHRSARTAGGTNSATGAWHGCHRTLTYLNCTPKHLPAPGAQPRSQSPFGR
jgi:hypothetical protein